MPDAEVLDAAALVRPERLSAKIEAVRETYRSNLPPRTVGIMMATSFATFVTLTGSYRLFF
jgi:hypothetical protein